jgi:hypothetical protein
LYGTKRSRRAGAKARIHRAWQPENCHVEVGLGIRKGGDLSTAVEMTEEGGGWRHPGTYATI